MSLRLHGPARGGPAGWLLADPGDICCPSCSLQRLQPHKGTQTATRPLFWTSLTSAASHTAFDRRAIRLGGKPVLLLSGSIHYPRSTPGMWPKLMAEARAAGLNTIESYVFWNYHQRELADYNNGRYDYSGRGNVTTFLQAAQDANLFVIWRFGPYICAEWPSGGMPAWLNQVPGDHPRSPTPVWEKVVGKWASDHFSLIAPFLAKNGGPVIMSQAENEYGCRASDPNCARYMQSLSDLAKKLDTGLLWENCHGTVAPGMIGASNGCGGSAGCVEPAFTSAKSNLSITTRGGSHSQQVCRDSRIVLPSLPGNFSDSSTFPAMITEDEQWFDYWNSARSWAAKLIPWRSALEAKELVRKFAVCQ